MWTTRSKNHVSFSNFCCIGFREINTLTLCDSEAYALGKKEKPPFVQGSSSSSSEEEDPVPDELLCLLCKDLMSDAVVIPCCGNSYCDECRFYLVQTFAIGVFSNPLFFNDQEKVMFGDKVQFIFKSRVIFGS